MSGGQNMRSVWTENGENSGGGCRMREYGNSKNGADREKISMRKPGRNRTAVLFLCAAVSVSLLFAGGCGRSVSPEDDAALLKEMNAAESADSSAETAESDDTGEAYRSPNLEEYNQAALDHMLQVEPKCVEVPGQRTEDRWTELEDISGIGEVEPYQMIFRDPDQCWQICQCLLDYYLRSWESGAQPYAVADAQSYSSSVEIMESTKIAGDDREFVAVVSFRYLVFGDEGQLFEEKINNWGTLYQTADTSEQYLYGRTALHIKMTEDYVFELADIADADTVLAAFAQADPDHAADYENALIPVIPKTADTGCFRVSDGQLQVTYDGGDAWTDVPLSTELLFERGDQRDGALSQVQDGSYTVSEDLAAIAYGGSTSTPVSVIFSTDQGKNWKKVTVPAKTTSVRQLFLCRAGQGSTLYLIATSDRSMSVEGEYLFRSDDGGASWKLVSSQYEGNPYHFTDTDASFTDENTGFLCIKSSQYPTMLYTADGGQNWRQAQFEQLPQGYTMAYAPSVCEEGLELYVGMDGYQKESGSVWRMVSADGGATWTADREYYFG